MRTFSLKQPNRFEIVDEKDGHVYYGFDQEWYASKWQRLSGCGPTTASTIFYYMFGAGPEADKRLTRRESPAFLEKTWRHVTPTIRGIPSTELLCKGVEAYARANSLGLTLERFDLSRCRDDRPVFGELLRFLASSLSRDCPVAFLNLHSGEEKLLDSWHWVTVVSLDCEEDGSAAFLDILDEGMKKRINLAQWYRTTTLGGGFVSFRQD